MPSPILKFIQGQRLRNSQLKKLLGKPKKGPNINPFYHEPDEEEKGEEE